MKNLLRFDLRRIPEERVEVLVVGSGIGGLSCALKLKELRRSVLILTRGIGNTYYSQGGIAGALLRGDSPYKHFLDTLRAGRGIANEEMVRILTYEGPMRIVDLMNYGVKFDGETTLEGGHSFKRVFKVKDYTGKAIYERLYQRVLEEGIPLLKGELQEIVGEERVEGVLYTDEEGRLKFLRLKALVLATGGGAGIYSITSNPKRVRGDGIGIALRFGALLCNLEFVQFHPTVFKGTSLLISESVRGEGAHLLCEGKRFINELLPRDEVARAIFRKMKEGKEVFLDLRPLVKRGINLKERFPTIYTFLRERGYEPEREPIPITPASHYFIGGISVDSFGRSTVEGLYAVGECACTGVHGANRLASNSLLEGIVFGVRTAYGVFFDLQSKSFSTKNFKSEGRGKRGGEPNFNLDRIRKLMWEYGGIERDRKGLLRLKEEILNSLDYLLSFEITPKLRRDIDLLLLSLGVVESALWREESRGVHYRKDFPYEREEFRKPSYFKLGEK